MMPLDPRLAALVATAANQPAITTMTAAQVRNRQPLFRADLMPFADMSPFTPIDIPGNTPLRTRLYRPAGAGRCPLLLYYHGGGFVVGDLDTHEALARNLCGGMQACVLAVDYRLAPEHPFPSAVDDAAASLDWAAKHTTALGADPTNILVCGDSAGAALAASAAVHARDVGLHLRGQILAYPVTAHHSAGMPSYDEFATGFGLTRADMIWYWRQYVGSDMAPVDTRAVAIAHPDLSGVAPAYIATAEFDPLRDEGEAYARRLAEAGVDIRMERYAGMNHGFWARSASVAGASQLYDDIFAWVRTHLD